VTSDSGTKCQIRTAEARGGYFEIDMQWLPMPVELAHESKKFEMEGARFHSLLELVS